MSEASLNTRYVGACVYGVRMPIIKQATPNLAEIIVERLIAATKSAYLPITINNKDIIGITECFLARAQGNYVHLDDIAADVSRIFPKGDVGVAFPILSRNRFANILQGIARGVQGRVYVFLSYPADEVGNALMDEDMLLDSDVNPYTDRFDSKTFAQKFGESRHPITQTNYIELYESLGDNIEVVLLNNPKDVLKYTNQIIVSSIHTRFRHKKILEKAGAQVITLDEICNTPNERHGWSDYGVLGSNYAGADLLKLFPRDADAFVRQVQRLLKEKTGKTVEVLIYGDGGFKCPKTKIWELADPVVSPGFTDGLKGMPHEIKIKAVADMSAGNAEEAVCEAIKHKQTADAAASLGTTPRQITDLVGSLCDLATGSGDKGTPVVLIKGYFDDYTKGAVQE